MQNSKKIKFYGKTWCSDCIRSKKVLDDEKIAYEYINVEEVDGAIEEIEKITKGLKKVPTIVFPHGKVMVEPSNAELKKVLEENKDPLGE